MNKRLYAVIMATVLVAGCSPATNTTTTATKADTKVETKIETTTTAVTETEKKTETTADSNASSNSSSNASSNATSNASSNASETPAAGEEKTGEGEAEGMKGPVKVKVTATSDKIIKVEVIEQDETPNIAKEALEKIPQGIVEKNSVNVDVISEATMTSEAIIDAVTDALEKMGFNPDDYK